MFKPLALAAALALASLAQAQPLTTSFTLQGELRDGSSPAAGTYDLRFRLYDALSGGTQQGPTLCADNVAVTQGRFSTLLDFGAQFAGQQRFLEVEVRADTGLVCTNLSGFTILGPRQNLTAAPNAVFSLNAGSATTATTAANSTQLAGQAASFYQNAANLTGTLPSPRLSGTYSSPLTISNPANIFAGSGAGLTALNASGIASGTVSDARLSTNIPRLNSGNAFGNFTNSFLGNVGIGTTTPGFPLHVASTLAALALQDTGPDSTQAGFVSYRNNTGTETAWVGFGTAGSMDFSIVNARSGGNILLLPFAGNVGIGVSTPTAKLEVRNSGTCVIGESTASSGEAYGVYGINTSSSGGAGVYGISSSGSTGVIGESTSTGGSGAGGRFFTNSPFGIGVSAFAAASSGSAQGVYGQSAGTFGKGVEGIASSASGSNYGVYGVSLSSSSSAYGVYAVGNSGATGTKSFRIDHPADPENKYLMHYCAESDEVINFYSGKVTLDDRGEAVVQLPAYFAAINKDPRYTLTPMGAPMPLLHLAAEVDEEALTAANAANPGDPIPACAFRIAGGAPNARVSWEVKALRNDRWVQHHGAPVEVEKQGPEKGTYQHPELYGQPPEKGMNYCPSLSTSPAAAPGQ